MRRWCPGLCLLGLLLTGCNSTQPMGSAIADGQPVPDITGEDIDHKPMQLSAYRGKVVLLDFSGTW
jgi:hypothetical protein